MNRFILTLLLFGVPTGLLAQPYGDGTEAVARNRRATREKAVSHAGPAARVLVECDYGDDGARALLNCSPETASRLAEFHASGGFTKVPRANEVFGVIARQRSGDEIAQWVIEHANELTDPDAVSAFLAEPITFVLSLKKLSAVVAEKRARDAEKPASTDAPSRPWLTASDKQALFGLVAVVGLIVFWIWWRRRAART
jgi:hypothetical protein